MPDRETIRASLDGYIKAFNSGDREAWLTHFAPDATQEDPVGAPVNTGIEAIGGFYDNLVAGFGVPEVSLLHEPVICGNEAVMAMHAFGGPEGSRMHIPVIIDHLVFDDDGRITSLRAFWDAGGIVPA